MEFHLDLFFSSSKRYALPSFSSVVAALQAVAAEGIAGILVAAPVDVPSATPSSRLLVP